MNDIRRVNKTHRCPICQKPDWCGIYADGSAVICMRVESKILTKNGGWLHSLKDPLPEIKLPKPQPKQPAMDYSKAMQYWAAQSDPKKVAKTAKVLGVEVLALQCLGMIWCKDFAAVAFPMYDPKGKIIGVRLRNEAGHKWAVPGSKAGLFIPGDGLLPDQVRQVLICEGPTDTAAALQLGYYAVGRDSCMGGVDMLCELLHVDNYKMRYDIVIVADRDGPGVTGAGKLGQSIIHHAAELKIICPLSPHKDMRDWLRNGKVTKAQMDAVISNTKPERIKVRRG